jgi:hypothetical protein
MKRLIITNEQLKRVEKILLESTYDTLIDSVIKVGDIIRISFKNTDGLIFKVIQKDGDHLFLENKNPGSEHINYYYLLSLDSLSNKKLTFKRAHKTKRKDGIDIKNPKTWEFKPLTDLKSLDIIRNNKIIDSLEFDDSTPNDPEATELEPTYQLDDNDYASLNEFRNEILSANEGNSLVITLYNQSKVIFCVDSRNGNNFSLYMIEDDNNELSNLRKHQIKIELEKDIFTDVDYDNFMLKGGNVPYLKLIKLVGEDEQNEFISIDSIEIKDNCTREDKFDNKIIDDEQSSESKDILYKIINDENLKSAFYKSPTLFNMFINGLKNKDFESKGVVATLKLIDKYSLGKYEDKIGESANKFKKGRSVKFKVLEPITKEYSINNKDINRDFYKDSTYTAVVKYGIEEIELVNRESGFIFYIVKELENNKFECILELFYRNNKTGEYVILNSDEVIEIVIEMLPDSEGYEYNKKEINK